MDSELEQEMMLYYDERAEEYEEFYSGMGPAIPVPSSYRGDVAAVTEMVSEFGTGRLIDIGCGTGFWLPHYAGNCSQVTLIDQSERMLSECRTRAGQIGVLRKCRFIHENFFAARLEDVPFDSAILGFFLSHLPMDRERTFFGRLRSILGPRAPLMVIDSAWSRTREYHRQKEGVLERRLKDGRRFRVFKRYFTRPDLEGMLEGNSFDLDTIYCGEMFLAAVAKNRG